MKGVIEIIFHFQLFYPVNFLRNVALNATETDFVYLADVDLILLPGIYDRLMENYIKSGSLQHKQVDIL